MDGSYDQALLGRGGGYAGAYQGCPAVVHILSNGIIQSDFLESEDRDFGRLDGIFAMMGGSIFASIKSTEPGANVGLI